MAISLSKLYELADEIKELRVLLNLNPRPANDMDAMEFLELLKTTPEGKNMLDNAPQFWEQLKTDPRVQALGLHIPNYWEEIQKDIQQQLNQAKSNLEHKLDNQKQAVPTPEIIEAQPEQTQEQDPKLGPGARTGTPGQIQQPFTSNELLRRSMEPRPKATPVGTSAPKSPTTQRPGSSIKPTTAPQPQPPAQRPKSQLASGPVSTRNPFANTGTVNMSTINLAALFKRLPSLGAAASLLQSIQSKQPGASANMDPADETPTAKEKNRND